MTTGATTARVGTGTATLATAAATAAGAGAGFGAGFLAATGAAFGCAGAALAAGIFAGVFAGGLAAWAGTGLVAVTVFGKGAFFAGDFVAEGRAGADVFFFTGAALTPRGALAGTGFLAAAFLAGTGFLLPALALGALAFLTADVLTVSPRDGSIVLARRARRGRSCRFDRRGL